MTTEQRLCDACGAAAGKADDGRTVYNGWLLPMYESIGPVALCRSHWNESISKLVDLILARRAAQPKEVDPRTLPVGAVYHHHGFKYRWVIVAPGFARYEDKLGSEATPVGLETVVLISLPPAEVELGTLAVDTWVKFTPHALERGGLPGAWQVENIGMSQVCCVDDEGVAKMFHVHSRVLRVPPPTSAGSGESATRKDAGAASATSDSVRNCSPQPADSINRWPNTPAEHHARLNAQLAQQVASGGQSCKAAWSLIERADRLRREAEEQQRSAAARLTVRRYDYEAVSHFRERDSGIASLRLERPLISWKRRK